VPPLSVNLGVEKYPTDNEVTRSFQQRTERIYLVEGTRKALELEMRKLEYLYAGVPFVFLPFSLAEWQAAIAKHLPEKL